MPCLDRIGMLIVGILFICLTIFLIVWGMNDFNTELTLKLLAEGLPVAVKMLGIVSAIVISFFMSIGFIAYAIIGE
jgi:hypothetical protein